MLLRAGEVVAGPAKPRSGGRGCVPSIWARGPRPAGAPAGRHGGQNGLDLTAADPVLTLTAGEPVPDAVVRTGPAGRAQSAARAATEWPWRWWVADSPGGLDVSARGSSRA